MPELVNLILAITAICSCLSAIAAVIVALYVNWDSKRPYVVCYLEHDSDHGMMNLVVANQGEGIAREIRIQEFDLSIVSSGLRDLAKRSFIVRGIPILVPQAHRATTVLAGQDMKDHVDDAITITLSYLGRGFIKKEKEFKDEFMLDYYSFSGSLYTDSDLHAIKKDCDVMAKAIKQSSQDVQVLANALRSTYE